MPTPLSIKLLSNYHIMYSIFLNIIFIILYHIITLKIKERASFGNAEASGRKEIRIASRYLKHPGNETREKYTHTSHVFGNLCTVKPYNDLVTLNIIDSSVYYRTKYSTMLHPVRESWAPRQSAHTVTNAFHDFIFIVKGRGWEIKFLNRNS